MTETKDIKMEEYTFTIFDGDPRTSGDTAWPHQSDVCFVAASSEEALHEAKGIAMRDGVEGDEVWILVWDENGQCVEATHFEVEPTEAVLRKEFVAARGDNFECVEVKDNEIVVRNKKDPDKYELWHYEPAKLGLWAEHIVPLRRMTSMNSMSVLAAQSGQTTSTLSKWLSSHDPKVRARFYREFIYCAGPSALDEHPTLITDREKKELFEAFETQK